MLLNSDQIRAQNEDIRGQKGHASPDMANNNLEQLKNCNSFCEMTSKDYYFDSYAHFGRDCSFCLRYKHVF